MFGFRRRKKEMAIEETNQNKVQNAPVVAGQTFNQIDVAVAQKMGIYHEGEEPLPFSSDRSLVNDMVTFAREQGIKLPRFTSDPFKIASAIAAHKEEK